MEFISKEQEAVVLYRINIGYKYDLMPNGFYLLYRDRHKMIINGMGYDTYTGIN